MQTDAAPAFHFEPVRDSHLPMLFEWLSRPHVREWWEDPETELGYIKDMLAGRDTTRPFVFSLGGKPTGYIQYWFIGDAQKTDWAGKEPWLCDLPADAVGIDVLIADEADLSKGIGSSVVGYLAKTLAAEGYEKIMIDPDPENIRAVRAYEKAGFRPVPHLLGRTGDALIMQYDLKENERNS